jgi:lysocardiolipin and lysophospholipid acyltransferase
MYFQGQTPRSTNFYWRRFRLADIPLDDPKEFELWLRDQWYKKDELMEQYLTTGRFPAMAESKIDYVETEVRPRHLWETLQIFTVVGICGLLWNNVRKAFQVFSKTA